MFQLEWGSNHRAVEINSYESGSSVDVGIWRKGFPESLTTQGLIVKPLIVPNVLCNHEWLQQSRRTLVDIERPS